ncbi:MAG TPA: ATP-binding cassette domain-containing protein [Bryobacterales bacterium]|nr:ATP-binding cassette domain-containing protein [Bryobacterales bacterium]
MPGDVEADGLTKDFRSFQRKEGIRGAIENLFVRQYKTVRAVDTVSFRILPGEMVGYIGPNGAGKSTTVKMLTGILEPTAGRAVVNGFVPYRDRTRYTRTIGVVFGQRTQLWWDIAVVESFRLLQRIYEVSDADYAARLDVFDQVLEIKRYLNTPVRKLSLGERMRCDLAASLLHNPPLLFLDEPTIGLDVVAKTNVRQFLKEVNRRFSTTMLLTTHDLADIEELCGRLMIIDHGRVLFDGALTALKRQLWRQMQVKIELREPAQSATLEALPLNNISRERVDDLTYRLSFDRDEHTAGEVIRQVVSSVDVRDVFIEEESIEEIVRRIYTGPSVLEFGPVSEAKGKQ